MTMKVAKIEKEFAVLKAKRNAMEAELETVKKQIRDINIQDRTMHKLKNDEIWQAYIKAYDPLEAKEIELGGQLAILNSEFDILVSRYRTAVYDAAVVPVEKVLFKYRDKPIGDKRRNAIASELSGVIGSDNVHCYCRANDYYPNEMKIVFYLKDICYADDIEFTYNMKDGSINSYRPKEFSSTIKEMKEKRAELETLFNELKDKVNAFNQACGSMADYKLYIESYGLKSKKKF